MKLLKDILYRSRIKEVKGTTNLAIEKVCFDSREVAKFSVFVAVNGTQVNGHHYIDTAIELGAIAIVCESFPEKILDHITYVKVNSSAESLAHIAANFYDNPSSKLKVIGVTGTNGKTSIVTMLFELFTNLGYQCGLLSTVVNRIGEREIKSTHTTSDSVKVNELIAQMVDDGCDYCFMEVSSHALEQHRVEGVEFSQAVFTNITHDHLDYHGTFNNYISAKRKLFTSLSSNAIAIFNKDDRHWQDMTAGTVAQKRYYSLKSMADFKGKIIENQFDGLQLQFNGHEVWTQLMGEFNASNLLALYGVAISAGEEELDVLTQLSKLKAAPGRFQQIESSNGVVGIVDYAHTPDALSNVLDTISKIRTGNEKVITVVGCGGDRDKTKRPKMAQIATKLSDQAIITSDNPRTEDPQEIIDDMLAGLDPNQSRKSLVIVDREQAIKTAAALAEPGDIILIAGKGHETYQDINGVKHHFNDVEILGNLINPKK
ncbi:MAG: UDP-N-acetylmuramoyl-L-alanyl-D-glutamate--2,6-diaminopimelate ligase [Salibacteraceae bacterium]